MSVKDRLQLILITFNRAAHVQNTLSILLNENSPVKDFDLLVLDNNSTDNTKEIVQNWQQKCPNIKYKKNHYNLGIAGNIAKAMEVADKDYVWIIGDDDKYDFSNWNEVEYAINKNEKIICLARYILPDNKKHDVATQLFQLTFITGGIYSTSLFNDITIRNAFDNIYTLFPHVPIIVAHINSGGKIYVVDKPIADNGMDIEHTDCTYTRGIKNKTELYERTNEMTWILGYSNAISLLRDKKLKSKCLAVAIPYKDIYGSWENFYQRIKNQYIDTGKINYFLEIYNVLPDEHKKYFHEIRLNSPLSKILSNIFSVNDFATYKVIKILGIKITTRRKNKNRK